MTLNVERILAGLPAYDHFLSVDELLRIVDDLKTDSRFSVTELCKSESGIPIQCVRFGQGLVTALVIGGPHPMEPISSLTVASLFRLFADDTGLLDEAGIEWIVIPCADPDGAVLNEGWTSKDFDLHTFIKNYFVPAPADQVDSSFPIHHKRLDFENHTGVARKIAKLIYDERPDFLFSLHNAFVGGAFFCSSRDLGPEASRQLVKLATSTGMPIQATPVWNEMCRTFAPGIVEMFSMRGYYDFLEKEHDEPERLLDGYGASSWEYLAEIKPEALSFISETGYLLHPDDSDDTPTGYSLRRFKLHIEAEMKYLVAEIIKQWDRVADEVDHSSPFFRSRRSALLSARDRVTESGGRYGMRDIILNPEYDREMHVRDRFQACLVDAGLEWICTHYQFVRLLKQSRQSETIAAAIRALERVFDEVINAVIEKNVDMRQAQRIPYRELVRVQLGAGLIALNTILDRTRQDAVRPE